MYQEDVKKVQSNAILHIIISTIVGLLVIPHIGEIKGEINLQLIAFNSELETLLPNAWTIISILLVIAFSTLIINIVFKLKDLFLKSPKGIGEWTAYILSLFILVPLCTYSYCMFNLITYFFNSLPLNAI